MKILDAIFERLKFVSKLEFPLIKFLVAISVKNVCVQGVSYANLLYTNLH